MPPFSTLSLNTNRPADLASSETALQTWFSCKRSAASLAAAVSGLGYTASRSSIAQPRRYIAVLSKFAAVVMDQVPGYLKKIMITFTFIAMQVKLLLLTDIDFSLKPAIRHFNCLIPLPFKLVRLRLIAINILLYFEILLLNLLM
jgi:hypothetical protein